MATQPAAPVLFIKLPRNVVERLQTIAPSEIQLSLGGGDKNVSGALSIGSARYDVRYRAERSGAPRLFQGKAPPYSGEGECANWVSRGRVAGKLTVLQPRSRTSAAPAADRRAANTAAGMAGHSSRTGATNAEQPAPHQTSLSAQPSKQEPLARARSSSAAKAAVVPQKKPGIVKQNREMLRERLLHYLAYSPLEESQVFEKIKAPSALALDTLASIGKKSGTLWTLLPEKYKDVQIEAWPRYNDRVRAQVISNALDAFDSLGLPDDDPDRVRMKQIQRRLVEGPEPSSSSLPAASNPPPSLSPPTAPKPTHNAPAPLPVLDGGSTASLPGSLAGASNAPATVAALKSPSDRAKQPVQVRSRPLQTQSFAMSPGISSPHVPSVETEAAVNRVHERLVQEMADRRIPTPADGSRSAARPRHPRGPSLSPIATLPQSLSPLPAPKIERAETIEDLERLQELLATTYSEYSQLRIRIDSHCTEFEPLSAALSSALAECREARRSALEKKKSNEADREEGEEIPGDGSLASELSLNVDPTADKCLPDGSRLYWYETDDGAAWLTDSPLMPPAQGRASDQAPDGADQPVRSRLLLPAEAHVLKTNQAIVDRYAELDGDDVRRWARRYLQLHAVIEQMSKEMERAYARISGSLLAECEALRDELGECQTDSMFDGDSQRDGHVLDMDSYRNSVATLPESGDGAASKS
ncbi:hypothetical protein GQ54DRAFT_288402 [Martensiomyces pterosporus]|nr:hypothetical protein GQ54DRAFT_288402 [Martensiomyces pterosporus]